MEPEVRLSAEMAGLFAGGAAALVVGIAMVWMRNNPTPRIFPSGIDPLAEDGSAESHGGGALLDGDEEVVGHAHRELGEGWAEMLVFIAQTAQMLEVRACGFRIVAERRNGHEAADMERGQRRNCGQERGQIGGCEAVLGLLG
jgi:hypothetical protein